MPHEHLRPTDEADARYRANTPQKIAADLGISTKTLSKIARGYVPKKAR